MSESGRNGAKAKTKTKPIFHFASGLLSGVSSAVILQPADLLKTRVQQSRSSSLRATLKTILSSPHPVASLWRGTVPSAWRTGLGSAVYFTTLNALRQSVAARKQAQAQAQALGLLESDNRVSTANGLLLPLPSSSSSSSSSSSVLPRLSSAENLATGAIARVIAGFILMPVTVIKVRFESDLYDYRSLRSACRDIYSSNGLRGFFTGFGATAVRDAPYAGLYVVFYELSKSRLNHGFFGGNTATTDNIGSSTIQNKDRMSSSSAATINFTSATIAAGLATAISNPFDAIKTRLQLLPAKYGNMFRTLKIMLREDGVRSFFDGLALRMARKGASSALAWTVYEELISRAERRVVLQEKDKERVGSPI